MSPVSEARRRTRSPRGQGEQLRDEILAAAEQLLVDSGDESSLSIRAIASAVGVTPPSIYLHFADRNELVFAVCELQADKVDLAMDAAAADGTDPLDRIRRRGLAYLRWGLDNPEHYRVLMMSRAGTTPERYVEHRIIGEDGLRAVIDDIAGAIECGLISTNRSAVEVAELFWMVIHGMVSMLIAKPFLAFDGPDEMYDSLFSMIRWGLAPRI